MRLSATLLPFLPAAKQRHLIRADGQVGLAVMLARGKIARHGNAGAFRQVLDQCFATLPPNRAIKPD